MAQLDEDLYLDDVEASQGFIDVQPGTYTMEIVANDIKPTKACDGYSEIINFRWQVRDEGDFHGQCVFQGINYKNMSEKAQEIGQRELKAVCVAVGYTGHVRDLDVLMYIPCTVTVGWSKAQNDYPSKPEIKQVKPYNAGVATGATAGRPAARPPAQAGAAPARATAPRGPGKPPVVGPGNSAWQRPKTAAASGDVPY